MDETCFSGIMSDSAQVDFTKVPANEGRFMLILPRGRIVWNKNKAGGGLLGTDIRGYASVTGVRGKGFREITSFNDVGKPAL